jgi:hypothetical protein
MATFLLGGLWHGAGWTFIIWGFLHGLAMVLHRLWTKTYIVMPKILAWFLTFNFVNLAWIFFRAKNWDDAVKVLKGMFGFNGLVLSKNLAKKLAFLKGYGVGFGAWMGNLQGSIKTIWAIAIFLCIALYCKNSNQMVESFEPNWKNAVFIMTITAVSMLSANKVSEFLYFNF